MFVTESLLAFTIFRDDFDIPFVIMFGFLLFIKCFHWLMADRVESVCMDVNTRYICYLLRALPDGRMQPIGPVPDCKQAPRINLGLFWRFF